MQFATKLYVKEIMLLQKQGRGTTFYLVLEICETVKCTTMLRITCSPELIKILRGNQLHSKE